MLLQHHCCWNSASAAIIPIRKAELSHLSPPDSCLSQPCKPNPNHLGFYSPRIRSRGSSICCSSVQLVDIVAGVTHNKVLVAAGASAAIGQLLKPFTAVVLYGKDNLDFRSLFQAGGFPSTHSSAVVAAATCLALERGFSDSIFGVAVVYAGLVMYDAQGVRREVGTHAKVLNGLLLHKPHQVNRSNDPDDGSSQHQPLLIDNQDEETAPVCINSSSNNEDEEGGTQMLASYSTRSGQQSSSTQAILSKTTSSSWTPLKESIGHTEFEVAGGALLGFLASLGVTTILS